MNSEKIMGLADVPMLNMKKQDMESDPADQIRIVPHRATKRIGLRVTTTNVLSLDRAGALHLIDCLTEAVREIGGGE